MHKRVVSALMFFPRGGSSHVARALAHGLPAHGWDVTVVSGSLPGHGDARRFYRGLDLCAVDFDDPGVPMHPSYEDRADAPDRVFARLDDDAFEEHVATWERALAGARAAEADVLHLHHLTPVHEAAARVAPGVPVVAHLHGTELLMLEAIADGPPDGWAHAEAWGERLRRWAHRAERLVLLSETQVERAETLLRIDPSRCVVLPNGFDPDRFAPRRVDRAAHWRRHLVDDPQGWRPGEEAGSVRYGAEDAERVAGSVVLLSVSRFTEVKRIGVLIAAFAAARERLRTPAVLVLVGGHTGEWEGEHPAETIDRLGARDVYLAGWHDHDELPAFFAASDLFALASVREQFGQVVVEAMACGVPPIAVDRYGPGEIVDADGPEPTGWLVEPDDVDGLARAIEEAIGDEDERRRRGQAGCRLAGERYAWPSLAARLAAVLDEVAAGAPTPLRARQGRAPTGRGRPG